MIKKAILDPKQKRVMQQKQQKRKSILITAEQLFSADRRILPTVSAISDGANIGKGTIYLYFKSKEHIFLNLLTQYHCDWLQQLATLVELHGTDMHTIIVDHNKHFVSAPIHLTLAGQYETWFRPCVPLSIIQNQAGHIKRQRQVTITTLSHVFQLTDHQLCNQLIDQLYGLAIGQWQLHDSVEDKIEHIQQGQEIIWQHFLTAVQPTQQKGWRNFFS